MTMREWHIDIMRAVSRNQTYPRAALVRSIQGTAEIMITVDEQGRIQDYQVVQETGEPILDRQIPLMMERLKQLPPPPTDANRSDLTFILPVRWVVR